MTWLTVGLAAVLAVAVLPLTVVTVGLRRRVRSLEARLRAHPTSATPSSDPGPLPRAVVHDHPVSLDEPPEFVITRVGEPRAEAAVDPTEPVTLAPGQFTDVLLRETVLQVAALAHGLRRALAPETRNRIRFEMRREVKRSRRQRRDDLRDARRAWETAQRRDMVQPVVEDTAA